MSLISTSLSVGKDVLIFSLVEVVSDWFIPVRALCQVVSDSLPKVQLQKFRLMSILLLVLYYLCTLSHGFHLYFVCFFLLLRVDGVLFLVHYKK